MFKVEALLLLLVSMVVMVKLEAYGIQETSESISIMYLNTACMLLIIPMHISMVFV